MRRSPSLYMTTFSPESSTSRGIVTAWLRGRACDRRVEAFDGACVEREARPTYASRFAPENAPSSHSGSCPQ